ncbi:MAG: hypothetical protein ACKVT2_02835 [Saprospiraceae bacterium]
MNDSQKNRELLDKLYQLMIEANLNRSEDEVLEELTLEEKTTLEDKLPFIRQMNVKAKAQLKRTQQTKAEQMVKNILDQFKSGALLNNPMTRERHPRLAALYSKYQGLSENDRDEMLKDDFLLELLEEIKKENPETGENE